MTALGRALILRERWGERPEFDSGVGLNMLMFNVDLDNTLIYSYKHEINGGKKCVERYQGKEVSFMSDRTQELLLNVSKRVLLVPTTTRTVEQYERIDLGVGEISHALVCNGGVLLLNGAEDEAWYEESLERIRDSRRELEKAERALDEDENRCLEVRNIRELFLFTKSEKPLESVSRLRLALDGNVLDVFCSGVKVYVMPKALTKGNAVMRLKEKLGAERVIAAGDSVFDVSMLQCAEVGIAPAGLAVEGAAGKIVKVETDRLFSETMLEYL